MGFSFSFVRLSHAIARSADNLGWDGWEGLTHRNIYSSIASAPTDKDASSFERLDSNGLAEDCVMVRVLLAVPCCSRLKLEPTKKNSHLVSSSPGP